MWTHCRGKCRICGHGIKWVDIDNLTTNDSSLKVDEAGRMRHHDLKKHAEMSFFSAIQHEYWKLEGHMQSNHWATRESWEADYIPERLRPTRSNGGMSSKGPDMLTWTKDKGDWWMPLTSIEFKNSLLDSTAADEDVYPDMNSCWVYWDARQVAALYSKDPLKEFSVVDWDLACEELVKKGKMLNEVKDAQQKAAQAAADAKATPKGCPAPITPRAKAKGSASPPDATAPAAKAARVAAPAPAKTEEEPSSAAPSSGTLSPQQLEEARQALLLKKNELMGPESGQPSQSASAAGTSTTAASSASAGGATLAADAGEAPASATEEKSPSAKAVEPAPSRKQSAEAAQKDPYEEVKVELAEQTASSSESATSADLGTHASMSTRSKIGRLCQEPMIYE